MQPHIFNFFKNFNVFQSPENFVLHPLSAFTFCQASLSCIFLQYFFVKNPVFLNLHIFPCITLSPTYHIIIQEPMFTPQIFVSICTHLSFLPEFAFCPCNPYTMTYISKGGHPMFHILLAAAAILCLGNFAYAYLTAQDNPYEE